MFRRAIVVCGVLLSLANVAVCDPPFNNPPGVDVWCGKAYREYNASFDPGGWLDPPVPSRLLRMSVNVYPRYNFYTKSETTAFFIVDTRVSDRDPFGSPYSNYTIIDGDIEVPFTTLLLTVTDGDITLVNETEVPVNVSGIEIPFDLGLLNLPESEGDDVFEFAVQSRDLGALRWYNSTVTVTLLQERTDGGSMARLDRLNGGIHVSSSLTENTWKPIFPVGFYTRWDWISWLVDPDANPEPPDLASNETKSLQEYKDRAYNLIHAVPPGGDTSFDDATLEKFLDLCDELELYVMYDMRHTYLNTSTFEAQLLRLQRHPSLLLYYTADEPDGWTDPLNGTSIAYTAIRAIDAYHPVSLVLNCYNFYFKEYTSGADIILEDTYPLIKNSTFSTVYNTPCNSTYGDCGCDFCHVNDSAYPAFENKPFQDVIERVDRFYQYQRWIGQKETQPVWGVPQWFYDADSFWSRWATKEEAVVMALLRINHGAMGIVGWLFPTSPEIEEATTELAKVLTREDVTALLVDAPGQRLQTDPEGSGDRTLDAVAWISQDEALVIIVWPRYYFGNGAVYTLPGERNITSCETLYGPGWVTEGRIIEREGTLPLDVSILKLTLGGY